MTTTPHDQKGAPTPKPQRPRPGVSRTPAPQAEGDT
jgi:hypothetical protein